MTSASDSPALLEVLTRHGVEFIVVGVTAAVLQGAPVVTSEDVPSARSGSSA
jgi:hypothetical protein